MKVVRDVAPLLRERRERAVPTQAADGLLARLGHLLLVRGDGAQIDVGGGALGGSLLLGRRRAIRARRHRAKARDLIVPLLARYGDQAIAATAIVSVAA